MPDAESCDHEDTRLLTRAREHDRGYQKLECRDCGQTLYLVNGRYREV